LALFGRQHLTWSFVAVKLLGKKDLAREIAHNFYDAVAKVYQNTDTFWENYSADVAQPGNPSKPHFCGWTAIAPIAIYREYIQKELTD